MRRGSILFLVMNFIVIGIYAQTAYPNQTILLSSAKIVEVGSPVLMQPIDSTVNIKANPKTHRFNITLAGYRYVYLDPYSDTNTTGGGPNFQLGFQKSRYAKKQRSGLISDAGYEIDFSTFLGMRYYYSPSGQSADQENFDLTKLYMGYNEYRTINLKFINLVLQGGPFLNYNYGKADAGSAGYLTSGLHLGEQIQKGIGKSENGYPKRFIGLGFDQYFALEGGYIGSFGLTLSF